MSEQDISIKPAYNVPSGGATTTKPCYLVRLDSIGTPLYLALELPDMNTAYIKIKGFVPNKDLAEVKETYATLIKQVNKKDIVEVYVPWHKVISVQNLVFVAK